MSRPIHDTTTVLDSPSTMRRLDVSDADLSELNRLMRSGIRIGNEQFEEESHLDDVIPKPWGHEYRTYVDEFFDFWALHITAPHGTSTHVHPRKLTYLICLGGRGVTSGLNQEVPLTAGTVVRIAAGAFHNTVNTGDAPLELVEVEVPRNKFDLMRLQDDYSRAGAGYESHSMPHPESIMYSVPHRPHAWMRETSPDAAFRFELRTGMDLFYRRRTGDIVSVPLDLAGVVHRDIDILSR